jgi:hypothetical protein
MPMYAHINIRVWHLTEDNNLLIKNNGCVHATTRYYQLTFID